MMNKEDLPKRKLSSEEKEQVLKFFLRRLHDNSHTKKEQNVVKLLKQSTLPGEKVENLSDKDLKKAIKRNRQQIMGKIKENKHPRKIPLQRIYLTIASSAAAIALLLFVLTAPFSDSPSNSTSPDTATMKKQFSSGNTMRKMILTDSSVVFLNKGTTIALYQPQFNEHTREVWLQEGEAFFEVKKDPTRPFIVHTPNGISTEVLGTSFNIRAYAQLEEQIVSVTTGRVQVYDEKDNKVFLDPDNKVIVNNRSNAFTAHPTDALQAAAWRTGKVLLEGANIKEVAFRLKQVFGIDLIYHNAVNEKEQIVTSFTIHTPLEEVITTICKLYNVKYKKENNRIELIK